MNNAYEMYETDPVVVGKGVDLEYGEGKTAFRVTVTFADGDVNKAYERFSKAKLKPFRHQIETETFSDAKYYDIMKEVYNETVILNWASCSEVDSEGNAKVFVQGVFDENWEIQPFNKANVLKALKAMPLRLFKDMTAQASKFALFRKGQLEEDAKN